MTARITRCVESCSVHDRSTGTSTLTLLGRAGVLSAAVALAVGCGPSSPPAESVAPPVATSFTTKTIPDGTRMRDVASVTTLERSPVLVSRGAFDLTSHCNLDRASGQPLDAGVLELSPRTPVLFAGWLVDPRRGTTGADLRLVLASADDASVAWTSRDVVRKANAGALEVRGYQPSMLESSFAFHVDLAPVQPGTYFVYVVFDEASGGAYCDPGRQIRVTR